ncbi:MAG: hypothetical protein U9N35_08420 [Euryarchaeota archaeon]|nr:hypothetical protein [Euryarchaeota archaeon]
MNEKISKFREIVTDTGPLLLYLTGFYNPSDLHQFNYNEDEFILFVEFLKNFKKIFTTPQVLAETSNLAKSRLKEERFSEFINFAIKPLLNLEEEYIEKNKILKKKELPIFGITDTSLIETVRRNRLLITDDGPLFWYCKGKNMPAIHLDRIRSPL